ncbi:TPA: phage tail protein [Enterobacter cancerogenus]
MGRFDEWFVEKDTHQREGVQSDDSTTPDAPAQVETREDSVTSHASTDNRFTEVHQPEEGGDSVGHVDDDTDFVIPGADTEPDVAPLPTDIADRKPTHSMRSRFKGHAALNEQMRDDWMKLIELHQDSFQALLFRPANGTYGVVDEETDLESFTEINNDQRDLIYEEPEMVWVLDSPDGRDSFRVIDTDGDQDGITDDVMVLRVASRNVTVGSILEWNEELSHGVARRWWYVHRIFGYGTQHVGSLYYCIPARNFDMTVNGVK